MLNQSNGNVTFFKDAWNLVKQLKLKITKYLIKDTVCYATDSGMDKFPVKPANLVPDFAVEDLSSV